MISISFANVEIYWLMNFRFNEIDLVKNFLVLNDICVAASSLSRFSIPATTWNLSNEWIRAKELLSFYNWSFV